MMKLNCLKPGALLGVGLSVLASANQAHAGEDMLVLIDQSGSMYESSVAGAPRWVVARQLAADTVNAAAADREYSLWTFQNTSFTNVVPFSAHATQAQIVSAIWALPNPDGSTPLAGSICDAVDELVAYMPTLPDDKRLELFSDGLENSTPPGECQGPSSADHAHPDPGSWEEKVFNKVRTGNAASASLPPLPLIINADFLFEHEGAIFSAFDANPAGSLLEGRARLQQAPNLKTTLDPQRQLDLIKMPELPEFPQLPELERARVLKSLRKQVPSSLIRSQILEGVTVSDSIQISPVTELQSSIGFYEALTDIAGNGAGGRYREFGTQTPRLPQLGDVTGDYCVNGDDIAQAKTNWGTKVAAGNPLDQNQDHVIDRFDYMTVLQNYGEGCAQ